MISLDSRWWYRLGVGTLALAVAVVFVPLPAAVGRTLAPLLGAWLVVPLALLAGVVGLWPLVRDLLASDASFGQRDTPGGEPGHVERPPIPGKPGEETYVGEGLDGALDRLAAERDWYDRFDTRRNARRAITETAVAVIAQQEGISREAAATRLQEGTWTDDPRAAAFLGDEPLPLSIRLRDLFSGRGFERRARATLAELADAMGVDAEVTRP